MIENIYFRMMGKNQQLETCLLVTKHYSIR